jgi:hypothetical protein
MNILIKKIAEKGLRFFRRQEEYWLGRQIIKNSSHAAPDFMIIGTAKAGTTSLFQYLAQHPDIVPSKSKELFYFRPTSQWKGLRWYLTNFPLNEKAESKLTFEATPAYLYNKHAPEKVSHLFPNMKFIASLRDPVKRAFSHWSSRHNRSKKGKLHDSRSFEEAVNQELDENYKDPPMHRFLYKGMYAAHLKNWYQYYPHKNILLLDFNELKHNPKSFLAKIAQFLSIENIYEKFTLTDEKEKMVFTKDNNNEHKFIHYHVSPYKSELRGETEKKLREIYVPYNEELKKITGRTFSWMK